MTNRFNREDSLTLLFHIIIVRRMLLGSLRTRSSKLPDETMKVLWEAQMKSSMLCSSEVYFTEKAGSNSLSSAHTSGRIFISFVSFTPQPCGALTHRLCLAGCQRRQSERLEFKLNGCGCLYYGCHSSSGPFQHTDIPGFPRSRCGFGSGPGF